MLNRILVLGFAISITACGGGDLPDTAAVVMASSAPEPTQALVLYSDADSLFTGGIANLSAVGGVPPYTYSLDTATLGTLNGSTFTSRKAGTATITVTDKAGAIAQHGISITDAVVAASAPVTNPIYRYRHDGPLWHHFTLSKTASDYAPNPEGIQYRVYDQQVTGSVKLYACKANGSVQIRFNTTNENCEGQNTEGKTVIGYVMPQGPAPAGHVSLWRHQALLCPYRGVCYYDVFESLSETPPAGFTKVGQIANTPIQ